jgi:HEAT repeat protein
MNNKVFSLAAIVVVAATLIVAQSKPEASVRALPLYDACAALQSSKADVPGQILALKDKDARKRVEAAESLARSCDARAVEPLLAALKDDDAMIRAAAVAALGQLGDRAAIEPLIEMAAEEDERVRAALVRTLASFQVYQASNAALNVFTNPGEKRVTDAGDLRARCLGILAVNQLRDVRFSRKAIGFLFVFLDSPDPALRRIAQETALELKNTRNGYHELIGILKQHNYPDFRRKAAYWLGQFKLESARDALAEAALGDRDPGVQKAAKDALEEMKKP